MPSKRKRQGSPKRAHAKTKQKPAAPTTELEPEPEEDNRTKEQYKTQAEEEERARRSTRFAFSEDFDPEPELERLVRTLNKRVDAISSLQLVREEFLNTIEEQGKAKCKAVRGQLLKSKRVLVAPMAVMLSKVKAEAIAFQSSLNTSRARMTEDFNAHAAKAKEELAIMPEAAGIRAVCDMVAELQDEDASLTARANLPGSSIVA